MLTDFPLAVPQYHIKKIRAIFSEFNAGFDILIHVIYNCK